MIKKLALFKLVLLLIIMTLQCIVVYYAWDECHYLIISIFILIFIKNSTITIEEINNEDL